MSGFTVAGDQGRKWVELTTQEEADEETRRMNHAVKYYFGPETTRPNPGRFFSLRLDGDIPAATCLVVEGEITHTVAHSNRNPFPVFDNDHRFLAAELGVSFTPAAYPYGTNVSDPSDTVKDAFGGNMPDGYVEKSSFGM